MRTLTRGPHLIAAHHLAMGLILTTGICQGAVQEDAKVALHLVPLPTEGTPICSGISIPPCNPEESHLTVHGEIGQEYLLYVIAMNVPASEGIGGVTFGISYDSPLVVQSWTRCADLESPGPVNLQWPASGTGNVLTWTLPGHCQNEPAPNDSGGQAATICGVLHVTAYGDGEFRVTRRMYASPQDLSIGTCTGETIRISPQRAGGKVGFGSALGRDPCKNAFLPAARFVGRPIIDYLAYQIKVSWIGGQKWPVNTVAIAGAGDSLALTSFLQLERYDFLCENDVEWPNHPAWDPIVVTPGPELVRTIIDSALADPVVAAGSASTLGAATFSILDVASGEGFESVLGSEDLERLFGRILPAVEGNQSVFNALLDFACMTGTTPFDSITNVTGEVTVTAEGIRYDEATAEYVREVVVKNTASFPLPAPVTLVVGTPFAVDVTNADGETCVMALGAPYFQLPPLSPGERHSVIIRFLNPYEALLDFKFRVYAGAKYR